MHEVLLTDICYVDTSIFANKLVCANLKTHHTVLKLLPIIGKIKLT